MKNVVCVGLLVLSSFFKTTAAEPTIILRGTLPTELGVHGAGNIYAPEIHRENNQWLMWYGGQGQDGHDRIHLAVSSDLSKWDKLGVVLDEAGVNHQNDPSIVRVAGVWWMFYTRAAHGINDEIASATSADGRHWELRGVVLRAALGDAWDSLVVSRPAVLYEGGTFKMWYDARGLKRGAKRPETDKPEDLVAVADERAVGYAESKDGLNWQRIGSTAVFQEGAGGIHVVRLTEGYGMIYESHDGTHFATSRDGRIWAARGILAARSGNDVDRGGHVTPFLLTATGGDPWRLFYGCNAGDWSRNAIAMIAVAPFGNDAPTDNKGSPK